MKRCHRAATALLVWYLLTPAWVGLNSFDAKVPLTRWYQAASFDTAADCERSRSAEIADSQQKSQSQIGPDSARAAALAKLCKDAQCVSAQDARLRAH